MRLLFCSLLFSAIFTINTNCSPIKAKINNPAKTDLKEMVFEINDPSVLEKITSNGGNILVKSGNETLPCQLVKEGGKIASLLVLSDLKAGKEKTIEILPTNKPAEFKPLTQAELSVKEGGKWAWVKKNNGKQQWEYQGGTWKKVDDLKVPEQHTDHSFDIRYEGPGWESDKIAYRFYLDWRNANDIFGKKTDSLVLQNIGLDGFDSYHVISGWGVDNFQVGNSLGIGSIAYWANGKANRVEKTDSLYSRIDYSGVLESKITTFYSGWETKEGKTNLTSELTIRAGSYLTKSKITLSEKLQNICTGIIKLDSTAVIQSKNPKGEWSYYATFGVQSLEKDHQGVAVFYRKTDLLEITADSLNHVIILKPKDKKLTWYFGATWEQDQTHIKTAEAFTKFLDEQLELLNKGMI
jgi:hypothetical protein